MGDEKERARKEALVATAVNVTERNYFLSTINTYTTLHYGL